MRYHIPMGGHDPCKAALKPERERGMTEMESKASILTPTRLFRTAGYLLLYPLVLMALSGDGHWIEGWVFSLWFVALCAVTMVYLYLKDPALLAERYRRPGTGDEESWDTYFVYAFGALFVAWFALMPLDARRFHWSPAFPFWATLAGAILLAIASFFTFRAFTDNTFLSPLVRIQTERNQRLVSTGVYGFVRHPLYLGAVCMLMGAPLFLGSVSGLVVGAALTSLLMARIVGEEHMLVARLEGYKDYRNRVRYRLIPYLW